MARKLGLGLLDLLLPAQCLTCDAPVSAAGQLCAACFGSAHFIGDPCCGRCGAPFEYGAAGGAGMVCGPCLEAPPPWGRARAALVYDDFSKRLILSLKHGDRTELARALAAPMARAGARLLAAADLLVPVPLHPRRLLARRYNQAALLAQMVGRLSGVAVGVDVLVRRRATVSLAEYGAVQRAAVVQGAFALRQGRAVAGRRVVLVDDVLTSGATAGGCARVLLDAGAASVDVLVAARVPDRRDG